MATETETDRFANATPRPWAHNGDGIVFAVRTQTNYNTFEQPAVAICRPNLQVMAAFVDTARYDVDAEAVYRANAELIFAAVNAYSPSDAEQLMELRRAAQEAIKVLKLDFPGSIKRKAAIAQLETAIRGKQ